MRRPPPLVGGAVLVALLLGLAGCGSTPPGSPTTMPSLTFTPSTEVSSAGAPSSSAPVGAQPVDATTVAIISQTAAGGRVDPVATPVDAVSDVRKFAGQFRAGSLLTRLSEQVRGADVPAGADLYAAVISIGCDVPPGVDVERSEEGILVTPQTVPSPLPECLAAVTTVALVRVSTQ